MRLANAADPTLTLNLPKNGGGAKEASSIVI